MTRMTRWGVTAVLATVVVVSAVVVTTAQDKPKPLYDRLGGVYSIATVVDDFIERLLVNDTLNANPAMQLPVSAERPRILGQRGDVVGARVGERFIR